MPATTAAAPTTPSSRCSDPAFRTALIAAVLCVAMLSGCGRRQATTAAVTSRAPAPDSFLVEFETTRGRLVAMAHREWAPAGVDRFHALVTRGYYDDARFFRVVRGFVAQFGLAADPAVTEAWRGQSIPDDTVRTSNRRGTIAFARGGPASRSTQLFINLRDNARLDTLNGFGFPPIAVIVDGLPLIDSLNAEYGEGPPRGTGPSQDSLRRQGNGYLDRTFPALDAIHSARVTRVWR